MNATLSATETVLWVQNNKKKQDEKRPNEKYPEVKTNLQ